jgi:hypothetical protein
MSMLKTDAEQRQKNIQHGLETNELGSKTVKIEKESDSIIYKFDKIKPTRFPVCSERMLNSHNEVERKENRNEIETTSLEFYRMDQDHTYFLLEQERENSVEVTS